ncbi:MAG: YajD family HNH nuclease [Acidiferrobacteraceae bacterium]
MAGKGVGPQRPKTGQIDSARLDDIVAKAHKDAELRMRGYRERSLHLHPHVCARCGRAFDVTNLHELTVHHKDHNHDNNPADGSNWENLCLYCHDWEHQKYSQQVQGAQASFGLTLRTQAVPPREAKNNPFADLKRVLEKKS